MDTTLDLLALVIPCSAVICVSALAVYLLRTGWRIACALGEFITTSLFPPEPPPVLPADASFITDELDDGHSYGRGWLPLQSRTRQPGWQQGQESRTVPAAQGGVI